MAPCPPRFSEGERWGEVVLIKMSNQSSYGPGRGGNARNLLMAKTNNNFGMYGVAGTRILDFEL
jgi:hypothetical protein